MSKVIKLKQSDIEKIVNNILKENDGEFDDFDTKIQPEELPGADQDDMFNDDVSKLVSSHGFNPNTLDFEGTHDLPEILIGKDPDTGQIILTNTKTGEIMTPPNQ